MANRITTYTVRPKSTLNIPQVYPGVLQCVSGKVSIDFTNNVSSSNGVTVVAGQQIFIESSNVLVHNNASIEAKVTISNLKTETSVEDEYIPALGIEVVVPDLYLNTKANPTMKYQITPSNATNDYVVEWDTSDTSIIYFQQDGTYDVNGKGTADVSATVINSDGSRFVQVIPVNVTREVKIDVTTDPNDLIGIVDKGLMLDYTITPNDSEVTVTAYSSSKYLIQYDYIPGTLAFMCDRPETDIKLLIVASYRGAIVEQVRTINVAPADGFIPATNIYTYPNIDVFCNENYVTGARIRLTPYNCTGYKLHYRLPEPKDNVPEINQNWIYNLDPVTGLFSTKSVRQSRGVEKQVLLVGYTNANGTTRETKVTIPIYAAVITNAQTSTAHYAKVNVPVDVKKYMTLNPTWIGDIYMEEVDMFILQEAITKPVNTTKEPTLTRYGMATFYNPGTYQVRVSYRYENSTYSNAVILTFSVGA
ncbi:hypothetical protein [Cedecea lapagei]|uniref:hypothetical protein n=1 Tax=Cedecea lapagei TaxID=158823 RepID=UPI001BCCF523|nr:hypothetical protein [Cedecea lapagei]